MVRDKMQASQSSQKAYADRRRRPLEFATGDHVLLRVTQTTGVGRALRSRKLSPKFLGPYQISRRIGPVTYEIALPPQLANLHPVFHVSQLRKYVFDPSHVLEADDVQIREDLTMEVPPITLEDSKVEKRQGKSVRLVKVIWDRRTDDSTWELEEDMNENELDIAWNLHVATITRSRSGEMLFSLKRIHLAQARVAGPRLGE
ncbi:uncharacterized protein LOC114180588 [Vigna unguiculata]|uniref:uncharacterized protein LOC114180588 n=1 Tax=Vigna unguiculata TaxID=3917 RepID=UPI0010163B4F|nr:uncharacterized protein LOC114180588 [Vigna unguiculata]